jgi:hypothetical protein
MPIGRYTVMDGRGRSVGTEEVRCAPGPAGWRYVSRIETSIPEPHAEVVDLVVDRSWRPVRLRIETGSHALHLTAVEGALAGTRDGEPLELPFGPEVELDYLSPCFNAVTAAHLGRTAEFDVIYLEPVACEPVAERQRYEHEGEELVDTPVGRFATTRWRYTSLRTGWSARFWDGRGRGNRLRGTLRVRRLRSGRRPRPPRLKLSRRSSTCGGPDGRNPGDRSSGRSTSAPGPRGRRRLPRDRGGLPAGAKLTPEQPLGQLLGVGPSLGAGHVVELRAVRNQQLVLFQCRAGPKLTTDAKAQPGTRSTSPVTDTGEGSGDPLSSSPGAKPARSSDRRGADQRGSPMVRRMAKSRAAIRCASASVTLGRACLTRRTARSGSCQPL